MLENIPAIWMLTVESWVFGLGKAFCCEQILSTCHWNTPPKSFLIPTNTRERERDWEGGRERDTCEDKINRAYSLTIHCHCDTFCILIPSKALHSLKWLSSTLLCFDPLIFMKHCLMPVIQIWQEFHFGFKPVVQNQQHLTALAFPDCKRPPI